MFCYSDGVRRLPGSVVLHACCVWDAPTVIKADVPPEKIPIASDMLSMS